MISASAPFMTACTARCMSAVVSTRTALTPDGSGRSVGPTMRITSAPRVHAASERAIPMRPLDGLVITRTGSRCSRVGPAVTTTVRPCHRPAGASSRCAAARIVSGSLMEPCRSLGPSHLAALRPPVRLGFQSGEVEGPQWRRLPCPLAPSRLLPEAPGPACSSCNSRSRPTRRGRRDGGGAASDLLPPPPDELVLEMRLHELVERPGGELLLEVHRAVAREFVDEPGELRRDQDAEVLVLRLHGDFLRGDDAHSCSLVRLLQLAQLGRQPSNDLADDQWVRPMALLHRRIDEVADLANRLLEIVVHDPVVVQYRPGDILLGPLQFLARLFEAQPQRLS